MNFDFFFERLLEKEGAYSNHRTDRGGETVCGISRNNHPYWLGWELIDKIKKKYIKRGYIEQVILSSPSLREKVKHFYYNYYFKKNNLHKIKDIDIAEYVFDMSVNVGGVKASKILQTSINLAGRKRLVVDGRTGPKTLRALHSAIKKDSITKYILIKCLSGELYAHYKSIIINDSSQSVFFRGWINKRVSL